MTDPDPLDELYAADPADFVARRGALAKELKANGDKELAAVVAAARKPPKTAAALGEAARTRDELVEQLFDAAARVSSALREGGDLRAAQTGYTAAVGRLVDAAAEVGALTSESMRERLRATVLAAGAEPDGEVARQLRIGAVRDDASAPGFLLGVVPSGAGPDGGHPPAPRPEPARPITPEPVPAMPLDEVHADAPADEATDADATPPKRSTRRLRAVRTTPSAEPGEPSGHEGPADESARLDAALDERARVAAERAAADAEAMARRDTMRRRRLLERDLDRIERRATRLAEAADEAEERARAARSASDDAAAELDELRSRLDDLES